MEIGKDAMAAACRQNDELVETKGRAGLYEAAERVGLDVQDLKYIAEQRALRIILISRGVKPPADFTEYHLTSEEAALHIRLTSMFMDGALTALRATQNAMAGGQTRISGRPA